MQIHLADVATIANFLVLLGIYGKIKILAYQHKLMWADYAERKNLSNASENGKGAAAGMF